MSVIEQKNAVGSPSPSLRTGKGILLKFGGILIITLLVLEIFTRIVWWGRSSIYLFDRSITLLPAPLVTEAQVETLAQWTQTPNRYVQFDPVLGWSIRPNAQGQDRGVIYTSNSVGMRSLREYTLEKPTGIIRIGTFGPSFTHGDEASDQATWQAQMEQSHDDLEVMNWGVGGYGTDQAFLRYQTQGAAYRPDIVIIGVEEDNLRRNVNRFRPFFRSQTGLPLTKPVFIIDGDELKLLDNPFVEFETFRETLLNNPQRFLDTVCPHDFFCDPARYQSLPLDVSTGFRLVRTLAYEIDQSGQPDVSSVQDPYVQQVNLMLLQRFIETVLGNGSIPVVLLFPERQSIEAHEKKRETAYAAGATLLKEQGIQTIDLAPAFVHAKLTENREYLDYYASDGGHFNELGNYIVSQTVLAHLCQQGILRDCS